MKTFKPGEQVTTELTWPRSRPRCLPSSLRRHRRRQADRLELLGRYFGAFRASVSELASLAGLLIGDRMSEDLRVDTDGLRAASAGSATAAAMLAAAAAAGDVTTSAPSGVGVSVFDAVCSSVRVRQAHRLAGQANAISAAAARYDSTEAANADTVAVVW